MHGNNRPSIPSTIIRRRSFTRVAHFDAALPDDLAKLLWEHPQALVDRGEPLRSKGARRTVRVEWNSQPYVLKHYVEPSWRHAFKRGLQSSRAWSTWKATHRLADAGIATPRPVACIGNQFGALGRDSFLMYPYVQGHTLRSYFSREVEQPILAVDRLWQQLQELWQRLVELQFSLADTNLGNFIVCPAGRLWVIDLDKARFHRLAFVAARHQARGWKQLLRSAAKC